MIDNDEQPMTRHRQRRQTLHAWREEQGKTMQRLAEEAKLSLSAVDNLENGRTQPTVEVASKIARALDVYIEQIIWLKPFGSNRPPSRLYRQFAATVQIEMAQAVFRVVNYHEPLATVLEWLDVRLRSFDLSPDEIAAAIIRVQQVVTEESFRQQAKALEAGIRAEIKRDPALRDLSVQGLVDARGDDPRWGVRLLVGHVGNLPAKDVYSNEDWQELKTKTLEG